MPNDFFELFSPLLVILCEFSSKDMRTLRTPWGNQTFGKRLMYIDAVSRDSKAAYIDSRTYHHEVDACGSFDPNWLVIISFTSVDA